MYIESVLRMSKHSWEPVSWNWERRRSDPRSILRICRDSKSWCQKCMKRRRGAELPSRICVTNKSKKKIKIERYSIIWDQLQLVISMRIKRRCSMIIEKNMPKLKIILKSVITQSQPSVQSIWNIISMLIKKLKINGSMLKTRQLVIGIKIIRILKNIMIIESKMFMLFLRKSRKSATNLKKKKLNFSKSWN